MLIKRAIKQEHKAELACIRSGVAEYNLESEPCTLRRNQFDWPAASNSSILGHETLENICKQQSTRLSLICRWTALTVGPSALHCRQGWWSLTVNCYFGQHWNQ